MLGSQNDTHGSYKGGGGLFSASDRQILMVSAVFICLLSIERVGQTVYQTELLPQPLHALMYGVVAALMLLVLSLTLSVRLFLTAPTRPEWLWQSHVNRVDLKVTPEVNAALEALFDKLLETHWYPWYQYVTKDECAANSVRQHLTYIVSELVCRICNNNNGFPFLIQAALNAASAHITSYHTTLRRYGGDQRPDFVELVLSEFGGDISNKTSRDGFDILTHQGRVDYIRAAIAAVLPRLLPTQIREDDLALLILRELLTTCVLVPALESLANPVTINNIIVSACASGTPDTASPENKPSTGATVSGSLETDRDIKSFSPGLHGPHPPIQVKLMQTYGISTSASLWAKAYSLPSLIRPGHGRMFFRLYLARECSAHLLDFMVDFDVAVDPTTDPDDTLTAVEIGDKYLNYLSPDCLPFDEEFRNEVVDAIGAGIHARTDRHEPDYQRRNGITGSRRVPHGGRFSALLVVRDRVYFKLQTDYLPGFLQSDLMWACALSTGARKRQSPAHRVNRKLFDESLSASYRTNNFTMPIDSMSTSELWQPSAISRTRAGSIVGDTVARRRANTMEDSPTVNNAVRVARYGSYKDNKDWDIRTEISREMSGMNVDERVLLADEKIPLKNLLQEAALEGFPNTSSKQPPWKCELVAGGWKANICSAYLVHTKTPYILYVIHLEECVDSMAADGVLSAKGSRVWMVGRRYSEFRRLYKMIRQSNPTWESSLVLPGKHSLKDNTKNTFIIKRMAGLQHLLSSALAHPAACSVPALRMFLTPKQDLSLLKMALKIGDPVELSPHPLFESHTASNTPPMQSMGTPHPPPTDFSHRTSCSDLEPDQFDADRSDRDDRGEKFLSKLSLTSESYSIISSRSDLNRPLSPVSSGMRHTAPVDHLGPLSTDTASNNNANTETQPTTTTTTATATQTQRTRTASSPRPSSLAQTRTVSSTIDDHDVFGITLRSDSRSSHKAVESPKRHSKATKKLSGLSSPPPVLIPVPATPPPLERAQMTTDPLKGPQIGKYGPNTSGADAVCSPTYHDDDEDGFVVVGLGKDGDGTWTKKPKRKSVILEATAHTHRSDELFGAHNDMACPAPDATNSGVLHNWAMGWIISLMRSAFRPAWRKPWIRQPLLFIESFWSPVVDTLGTRLIWLIVGSELEPARLCDTIDLISLKLFTGEPAPTLTEDEMAALRADSKRLLQEAMPGVLKLVLGPATLKNGLSTTHQMLQHEPLNHHLIYILLDAILAYLFPDVFEPPDIMDYNKDI